MSSNVASTVNRDKGFQIWWFMNHEDYTPLLISGFSESITCPPVTPEADHLLHFATLVLKSVNKYLKERSRLYLKK